MKLTQLPIYIVHIVIDTKQPSKQTHKRSKPAARIHTTTAHNVDAHNSLQIKAPVCLFIYFCISLYVYVSSLLIRI